MYLSVNGECRTRKTIEKSQFITTARHISSEEEAQNFIAEMRKKYADATHNCYAYVADRLGNCLRFSDDGEPSGTAGMPILDVIRNKKLYETAVVVTRYFGGIKLGAGGLVRAYSACASENLDATQKVLYEMCSQSEYTVAYQSVDLFFRFFSEKSADIIESRYENDVTFVVAVKKSQEQEINLSLINRLNGKVTIKKLKEYYFPFKIS